MTEHMLSTCWSDCTLCVWAGAQRLIPQAWRRFPLFDNVFKLVGVPVCTVQLRYAGWVTELADAAAARNLDQARPSTLWRCWVLSCFM